jgi:hypothetical protein
MNMQEPHEQARYTHLPDLGRNIKGGIQNGRYLHLVIDLEQREHLSTSEKSVVIANTPRYGMTIPGTNITLQLGCYIKRQRG